MDYEPLACAEKLVADDKRANSVVAGAATGIANHVRVAFRKASELCRIEPRVHASQNREAPRGRHGELTFSAKAFAVGAIGGRHFIKNSAHKHNVKSVRRVPLNMRSILNRKSAQSKTRFEKNLLGEPGGRVYTIQYCIDATPDY